MRRTRSRLAAVLVIAAVCAAALSSLAFGAAQTRDGYVAAVEPICKDNVQANERILAGARQRVVHGKLKPAAIQFQKAARALKKALAELKAVPRPPEDAATLKRWFAAIEVEVGFFEATAKDLLAGDQRSAERMSAKLLNAAVRANVVVVEFEFHYCRARPSEFT